MATPPTLQSIPKVRIPLFAGSWIRRILIGLVPLVLLTIVFNAFSVYVLPSEFAVRQVYFGPGQGVQKEIYGPGLHFVVPGYEQFHVFPRNLQILEFNDDIAQASAQATYVPSISIQTSEGYRVVVDITIAYRIIDPWKVVTTVGPGNLYESALVKTRAEPILRQTLGVLDAANFYEGTLRRQKALEARDLMQKELEPAGIQVWNVLVRHYRYDERYQEAIEQRKIQDQMVFKNRAEALAAQEEAEKNRVAAEGQAIVDVEKERGTSEVRMIAADGDLYSRKRVAEGDMLVELARAGAKQMENDALSAAGASNIVGLRMAEAIENTQIIVVPTDGPSAVNPLDLDQLVGGW